ncbi:MAG: hypothetical protein KJ626_13240 [Verrucomicrobia bacterium]|nr:hypothetical protein [Verrucomicrobiota bacterium]
MSRSAQEEISAYKLPKWREYTEWILVHLALTVIPLLSRRTILALARTYGRMAFIIARGHRRVARANLKLAFGDELSDETSERILRANFEQLALVALDILWFARHTRERLAAYVVLDSAMKNAVAGPGPQVCITGHFGNWELLGQALNAAGYPVASVAAPLDNPRVDKVFLRIRSQSGQVIVPRDGAIRPLLRILRGGGKVGLLVDQNTKLYRGGIFVDFFGRPVPVSEAPATLALRTGAQILIGFCLPQSDGKYRAHLAGRIDTNQYDAADMKKAVRDLTQAVTSKIEEEVRKAPETWLWTYKRWKYVGPGFSRQDYPPYAKTMDEDPLWPEHNRGIQERSPPH